MRYKTKHSYKDEKALHFDRNSVIYALFSKKNRNFVNETIYRWNNSHVQPDLYVLPEIAGMLNVEIHELISHTK